MKLLSSKTSLILNIAHRAVDIFVLGRPDSSMSWAICQLCKLEGNHLISLGLCDFSVKGHFSLMLPKDQKQYCCTMYTSFRLQFETYVNLKNTFIFSAALNTNKPANQTLFDGDIGALSSHLVHFCGTLCHSESSVS